MLQWSGAASGVPSALSLRRARARARATSKSSLLSHGTEADPGRHSLLFRGFWRMLWGQAAHTQRAPLRTETGKPEKVSLCHDFSGLFGECRFLGSELVSASSAKGVWLVEWLSWWPWMGPQDQPAGWLGHAWPHASSARLSNTREAQSGPAQRSLVCVFVPFSDCFYDSSFSAASATFSSLGVFLRPFLFCIPLAGNCWPAETRCSTRARRDALPDQGHELWVAFLSEGAGWWVRHQGDSSPAAEPIGFRAQLLSCPDTVSSAICLEQPWHALAHAVEQGPVPWVSLSGGRRPYPLGHTSSCQGVVLN